MRITLHVGKNQQVLAKHAGFGSTRVRELFGPDTLPTAYVFDSGLTAEQRKARADYILEALQALNPGQFVEWSETREQSRAS